MFTGKSDMTPFLRKILGMNWVLVLVMYGLLIFGVFMIESAARHVSVPKDVLSQFGGAGIRPLQVRNQLERAGLKTYTHVAETAEGRRIRVRLGPFTTRADADKAAAKAKALGVSPAILTL